MFKAIQIIKSLLLFCNVVNSSLTKRYEYVRSKIKNEQNINVTE